MKDRELSKLEDENRKLKSQNNNLKKEVKRLKSELKTGEAAWDKTEAFLKNITKGRSLEEVIKDVKNGKGLSKLETVCPKCSSLNITLLKYENFRILTCANCNHREKIEEKEDVEQ